MKYLTNCAVTEFSSTTKQIVFSNGNEITTVGKEEHGVWKSNLEEADARVLIASALRQGHNRICIKTVDSDIVCILLGAFDKLIGIRSSLSLIVAFGTPLSFKLLDINAMALQLPERIRNAVPAFHLFTGQDSNSFFYRKGKITFWKKLASFPEVIEAFLHLTSNYFCNIDEESEVFKAFERYVIIVYDTCSITTYINECRLDLFSKKKQELENCPPTRDALLQHVKRTSYLIGKDNFSTFSQ